MWLALDTATDRASLALGGPAGVLAEAELVGARRHAAGLLPALDDCLHRAGAAVEEIEAIVLADGPGSFTGLRVGFAVTKGLLRVAAVPCWTAPSLLACAAAARTVDGPVLAVASALRGEVYAAAYQFSASAVRELLGPTVLRPEALAGLISRPATVVGPGAALVGPHAPTWPRAADLLALVGWAGALHAVADPATWEPVYGRPAEAQAQWERTHGRPLADSARA